MIIATTNNGCISFNLRESPRTKSPFLGQGVILARASQNVATAPSCTLDLSAQPAVTMTRPVLTQSSPNNLNAGMRSSL